MIGLSVIASHWLCSLSPFSSMSLKFVDLKRSHPLCDPPHPSHNSDDMYFQMPPWRYVLSLIKYHYFKCWVLILCQLIYIKDLESWKTNWKIVLGLGSIFFSPKSRMTSKINRHRSLLLFWWCAVLMTGFAVNFDSGNRCSVWFPVSRGRHFMLSPAFPQIF